ncbi:chaperone NapD [[Haemophilus] felis]|uniref:Chaperone NapD n=1 Tax=[Haemophilus] felis TaxID=123822 RepID=A0A1T0AZU6_9PAST|nr:chaperone NapD [[Haemophilus] felis]NBI41328.1 chaperone NapD [[Haemophilus] felis]NBI43490.1 chaperone NapD [[Haemophilus] felis]OOS03428.1 nitrate reductase [[Haemophilus] felis]
MTTQQININNAKDWYVCGLVVQGNPDKMLVIQQAISTMPNTEVPALDEQKGKMVVVMQSHDQNLLLEQIESVKEINGVITVSLVYHQQDEEK